MQIVQGLGSIADPNGEKQVFAGPMESWPATPAAEVIADSVSLSTLAAGGDQQLVRGVSLVAFYPRLTRNVDTHERELLPLVKAFTDAMRHLSDRPLGGLTED